MTTSTASPTIRAAGCVVWRVTKKGNLKVLLIHRPQYDDWSFPKGKCESGEDSLACALREVAEEVNVTGVVGSELSPTTYVDQRGRDKSVRYWALAYISGDFVVNNEVDAVRWAKVPKAAEMLTYAHDVALLAEFSGVV